MDYYNLFRMALLSQMFVKAFMILYNWGNGPENTNIGKLRGVVKYFSNSVSESQPTGG